MVLSFDLSLRGAGVSSLLIVFVMNLIVTPQLLDSWEEGMLRDNFRRQLQDDPDRDYDEGGRQDPGQPWQCVQTVCGAFTWDDAVRTCAGMGAEVCTEAQFDDPGAGGFVLSRECGDADIAGTGQVGADAVQAFVQSSACTDVDERLVITNACMDWENDCCVGSDKEEAACAAGYVVREMPANTGCPSFECVPVVSATASAADSSQGPSCVSATTQVNRVACCAVQACMENGGRDNDCCTGQDTGACMGGCTLFARI